LPGTLERLLDIPTTDLRVALSHASDVVADALGSDKVDAFLYDPTRDSLVAVGTSNQPLSARQKKLGLDVLPLSNGGRVVQVYRTGQTFSHGRLQDDPDELRGVKEALGVRSEVGVPLDVGGSRRGMMMVCSLSNDYFSAEDVRFAEAVARWVGIIVHRAELIGELTRQAHEEGRRAGAEELVTVLAHDLRNFIAPVNIIVALIKQRAERDRREADARDAARAERALKRVGALISDILDVARIDQGLLQIEPRPIDLVPLVQDTAGTLSTPEHPISVRPSGPLIVGADAARVRQCLENLISNALKHSPKDGAVSILVRPVRRETGEFARVDVVDEGLGIPPDLLPRIFERFVTGKQREGGLGLGLYLARRIASLHDGELTVTSAPGKGACFSLYLPVYEAATA
jgi:two-component system OmpR family sensor kinase